MRDGRTSGAVRLLAQAAKESVAGTIGAGVSLMDARGCRTGSGYTDGIEQGRCHPIQLWRNNCGEGPCLTARAAGEPVLVRDLAGEQRWPEWRKAVRDLPITSVVSAPLVAGRESLGALKLHAAAPGVYDESSAALLQLFAAPAATLLAHIQASEAPHRMAEGLQASLYTRDLVNRACGALMERLGLNHEAALQQLMKFARNENTALQHVSERVLAGTLPPGA